MNYLHDYMLFFIMITNFSFTHSRYIIIVMAAISYTVYMFDHVRAVDRTRRPLPPHHCGAIWQQNYSTIYVYYLYWYCRICCLMALQWVGCGGLAMSATVNTDRGIDRGREAWAT